MIVNQTHLSFLDQLVKDSRPFESCAILLGKCDKGQYFVQEIIPTQNEESSEIRFTIDDNRLFEIYKLADDKNMSVIGIFHSHPSLPFPSETDKVYMKINPVPWIIK
jgi:proteasome lid subunit RPN8/RPN11